MQLRDFCTDEIISIEADQPIDNVIQLFQEHDVHHVPVLREGKLVGVASQGDMLMKVGGLRSEHRVSTVDPSVSHAGPTTVGQIMSPDIVAVSPEEPIVEAARLMLKRKIAAVLIVADKTLMGIITARDYIARFFDDSELLKDCRLQNVAEHMSTDVVTATPNMDLFAILRLMSHQIHHLPVVDDGKVVGILSDHDVQRALALDSVASIQNPGQSARLMDDFDAARIMHRSIISTTADVTLAEAAELMVRNKIGSIPVIEDDRLIGIITETDILKACVATLES